jgi:hypothetical protein
MGDRSRAAVGPAGVRHRQDGTFAAALASSLAPSGVATHACCVRSTRQRPAMEAMFGVRPGAHRSTPSDGRPGSTCATCTGRACWGVPPQRMVRVGWVVDAILGNDDPKVPRLRAGRARSGPAVARSTTSAERYDVVVVDMPRRARLQPARHHALGARPVPRGPVRQRAKRAARPAGDPATRPCWWRCPRRWSSTRRSRRLRADGGANLVGGAPVAAAQPATPEPDGRRARQLLDRLKARADLCRRPPSASPRVCGSSTAERAATSALERLTRGPRRHEPILVPADRRLARRRGVERGGGGAHLGPARVTDGAVRGREPLARGVSPRRVRRLRRGRQDHDRGVARRCAPRCAGAR